MKGEANITSNIKNCEMCGVEMVGYSSLKKFCYDCVQIRRCAYPKVVKHKKRKVKKIKGEIIKCLVCGTKFKADGRRSYCNECRFLPSVSHKKV